jgi:hypothetical protein
MGDQDATAPRTEPVRIVGMRIAPPYPPGASPGPGAPVTIVAQLDPGPGRAELGWWKEQLLGRVKVGAWGGAGAPGSSALAARLTQVHVEAPAGELEAVARRLVAAVDEANAAYPDRYPAWRRERDAQDWLGG